MHRFMGMVFGNSDIAGVSLLYERNLKNTMLGGMKNYSPGGKADGTLIFYEPQPWDENGIPVRHGPEERPAPGRAYR